MRLIAAKFLWSFDLTLDESSSSFPDAQVFNIWQKKPLFIKLERVQR